MSYPISVKKNDYHKNPKRNDIYTPVGIARFLFDLLKPNSFKGHIIFDPAIGSGRLTDPWFDAGAEVYGCDIVNAKPRCHEFHHGRFEDFAKDFTAKLSVNLVVCNPPFNGSSGRKLYPEVFLRKIFELFGPKVPVAIICPMGFRLNQRKRSARWQWLRDCGAQLTSIISLPIDVFPDVAFHAEILIFNRTDLQPHYFLPESSL